MSINPTSPFIQMPVIPSFELQRLQQSDYKRIKIHVVDALTGFSELRKYLLSLEEKRGLARTNAYIKFGEEIVNSILFDYSIIHGGGSRRDFYRPDIPDHALQEILSRFSGEISQEAQHIITNALAQRIEVGLDGRKSDKRMVLAIEDVKSFLDCLHELIRTSINKGFIGRAMKAFNVTKHDMLAERTREYFHAMHQAIERFYSTGHLDKKIWGHIGNGFKGKFAFENVFQRIKKDVQEVDYNIPFGVVGFALLLMNFPELVERGVLGRPPVNAVQPAAAIEDPYSNVDPNTFYEDCRRIFMRLDVSNAHPLSFKNTFFQQLQRIMGDEVVCRSGQTVHIRRMHLSEEGLPTFKSELSVLKLNLKTPNLLEMICNYDKIQFKKWRNYFPDGGRFDVYALSDFAPKDLDGFISEERRMVLRLHKAAREYEVRRDDSILDVWFAPKDLDGFISEERRMVLRLHKAVREYEVRRDDSILDVWKDEGIRSFISSQNVEDRIENLGFYGPHNREYVFKLFLFPHLVRQFRLEEPSAVAQTSVTTSVLVDRPVKPLVEIDLPRYSISNRYAAGSIIANDESYDRSDDKLEGQIPTLSLAALRDVAAPDNQSIQVCALTSEICRARLLTLSHAPEQRERITYVYAGRGESARVPRETDGGVIVLVCPASQEQEARRWVGENRDVMLIDHLEGIPVEQHGLLTSRRLAALSLTTQDYIEMDDNLEDFYVSPQLMPQNGTWEQLFHLFRAAAEESGSAYVSARTYRPIFNLPNADRAFLLENDGTIGSKIGYVKKNLIKEVQNARNLLPFEMNVWGEDVWKWRMLSRQGMPARILDPSVLYFLRVRGGKKGVCAATVNGAGFWLSDAAKARYLNPSQSEFVQAVYRDMVTIVTNDIADRSNKVTSIDLLPSNERTEKRLHLFMHYARDFTRISKELFQMCMDHAAYLEVLKSHNGQFGMGALPNNFFEIAERWLLQTWEGANKERATDEIKIRMIAEALKGLYFVKGNMDEQFQAFVQQRPSILLGLSQLRDLLDREISDSEGVQEDVEGLLSDAAFATFIRLKEMEQNTFSVQERPYQSRDVLTFVMVADGFKLALETATITFDSQGHMSQIQRGDTAQAQRALKVMTGSDLQPTASGVFTIDSCNDSDRFIQHLKLYGMRAGDQDIMLLPVKVYKAPAPVSQEVRGRVEKRKATSDEPMKKVRPVSKTTSEGEESAVVQISQSSSSTTTVQGRGATTAVATDQVRLPAFSLESGAGFMTSEIEELLNRTRRAIFRVKMAEKDVVLNYPFAQKLNKIRTGEVALTPAEKALLLPFLKDYQVESVEAAELAWKAGMGGILIGNDMGTGKTFVMIELMLRRVVKNERVLFIAPDSTLGQTQKLIMGQMGRLVVEAIKREIQLHNPREVVGAARMRALCNQLDLLKRNMEQAGLSGSQAESLKNEMQECLDHFRPLCRGNHSPELEAHWLTHQLARVNPFTSCKIYKPGQQHGAVTLASSSKLKDVLMSVSPALIVVDEAGRIKNRETQAYKDLTVYTSTAAHQPKILLATGTPIENYFSDITSLIQLLQSPQERQISIENEKLTQNLRVEARKKFEEFEVLHANNEGIEEDQLWECFTSLVKSFVVDEVFKWIVIGDGKANLVSRIHIGDPRVSQAFNGAVPQTQYRDTLVELSAEHKAMVEAIYRGDASEGSDEENACFLSTAAKINLLKIHPICGQWIQQSATIYNKTAEQTAQWLQTAEENEFNLFIQQSGFLQAYVADLNETMADGYRLSDGPFIDVVENIAVGVLLQGVLNRVLGAGQARFLNGDLDQNKKEALINAFAAKQFKALILTSKTGGVGLDLGYARAVRRIQNSWNPGEEKQADARINRVGVSGAKTIISYDCQTSMDRHLQNLHLLKNQLFKVVFDEYETASGIISKRGGLTAANVKERFENYLDLIVQMKPAKEQIVRNSRTVAGVKNILMNLVDPAVVLDLYKRALPAAPALVFDGVSYMRMKLPPTEFSWFKIIAAKTRMVSRGYRMPEGTTWIPEEWYSSWETWKKAGENLRPEDFLRSRQMGASIYSEDKAPIHYRRSNPNALHIVVWRNQNGQYDLLQPIA